MRTAILLANLNGYLNASLRALARAGNKLFVAYQSPRTEAPFDETQFDWIDERFRFESEPDEQALLAAVRAFNPELLIVASWNRAPYRRVCREFRGRAVRVCCMDNQWMGRPKQWLGVMTSPVFMRRMFDAAFVAGERQAVFARKLGFSEEQIWRGLYCCDHSAFHSASTAQGTERERAFLYVGRFAQEKAVDTLIEAYRSYRRQSSHPWPLWVAGVGPMSGLLRGEPGVERHGFVQPRELPQLFARAGCFVLPSRFEPWGVVIHEATASGLPVICTERCGAAVHLVQDGYNGFVTSADDPEALARAMERMSAQPLERLQAMSQASAALSWQFTPERWASYVEERAMEASRSVIEREPTVCSANVRRKARVVYWNNMPSPYVVGRFNALAIRGNLDFEGWFSFRRESDRSWDVRETEWLFHGTYLPQTKAFGRTLWDARSKLREAPPDLLVSGYDSASWVLGSLAARACGCRTAFRFLPTYDTWVRRAVWKEALKHVLFRTVEGVKVSGPCAASRVSRYGVPPQRVHRVTQTIDLAHFSSAREVSEAERNELRRQLGLKGCVFIYVGRLFEGKGVRHLIEAFGRVRAVEADVSLLILGDGLEEQKYRAMAASIPNVVFGGFVQPADIPRYYAAADVFVFPTLGDPHGLVVEEAMAAGLPVISTSSAGDIELRVPDGIGGCVIPPANAPVLAERMLTLARDPKLRRRFAKKGIEMVQHRAHEQWAIDFELFVEAVMREPRSVNLPRLAAWTVGKTWMASNRVPVACVHAKADVR